MNTILPNVECDEQCAEHADDCDGFCDHYEDHSNGCLQPEPKEDADVRRP